MRLCSLLPLLALTPGQAWATCPEPERPNDPVCEPRVNMLRPGVHGRVFAPLERDLGTFLGGGLTLALLDWSTPRDTSGPGLGRLEVEASVMAQTGGAAGAPSTAWAWGVGPALSFEKNPSRRFLVPHYAAHLGGVRLEGSDHHLLLDASLGLVLVQTAPFTLDLSGGWVLPFRDPDTLSGFRAQLSAMIGGF
jgi:hypothetical protein